MSVAQTVRELRESDELERFTAAALAAIYLPRAGAHLALASRWKAILAVIRLEAPNAAKCARRLRVSGCWQEALLLEDERVLAEAYRVVGEQSGGVRCVTAACREYPARWRSLDGAPPALWQIGHFGPGIGSGAMRWLAVAGTREPSMWGARMTRAAVAAAHELGCGVLSGGAVGVDRLAATSSLKAAGNDARVLEVLPRGFRLEDLAHVKERQGCVIALSACAPGEGFSTAAAMRRNRLIYAAADTAVAIEPRFRSGGTWHGACEALRLRLCRLVVAAQAGVEDRAARALKAMGAAVVDSEAELRTILLEHAPKATGPALFSYRIDEPLS